MPNQEFNPTKFIAYFDLLGYKELILNNDSAHHFQRGQHVLRDVEMALSLNTIGKGLHNGNGYYDIKGCPINCLNISDTIVFYTDNIENEDHFQYFLEAVFLFNHRMVIDNIPLRGAVVIGDLFVIQGDNVSNEGGQLRINSIGGRGLVDAHLKAESQQWAGSTIDNTVIDYVNQNFPDSIDHIQKYALVYYVPYKNETIKEFAFKLSLHQKDIMYIDNYMERIDRGFTQDNKPSDHPSVKEKLENTQKYYSTFFEAKQQ